MRLSVVLSVCMLVSFGLAGCADGGSDDLSASGGLKEAKARADTWQEDAVLVAAFAMETSDVASLKRSMSDPDQEEMEGFQGMVDALTARADQAVGDGRAPAWVYLFAHEKGMAFVVVGVTGTSLHAMEAFATAPASPLVKVREDLLAAEANAEDFALRWEVDSSKAADLLREGSEAFAALVASGKGNVSWELSADFSGEREPVWNVHYEANGSFGSAVIDAMTGEVLSDERLDGVIAGLEHESGTFEGGVDVLSPTAQHSFRIDQEGHPSLEVHVTPYLGSTGQAVVRLTGPDGASAEGTLFSAGFYSAEPVRVDAPNAGDWTVEVELETGALIDYRASWCAAGLGNVPGSC